MSNSVPNNETQSLPWSGKEPIYDYIRKHLNSDGILSREHEKLPDDTDFFEDKQIRWEPGAMDGVSGYLPVSNSDSEKKVERIANLIKKQVQDPCDSTRSITYQALMEDDILNYIDPFLDYLKFQEDINFKSLYKEALWFAREGAHRGVVKMGVLLLGLFKCEDQSELLLTLGKHEEFTLYVVTVIRKGFSNPNQILFELAKYVDGWGKINLVENLNADSDEIKNWLLRHGCENKVMDECLAFICASRGDLNEALNKPSIDFELYLGASTIIAALINSYPAEDIDDYMDSMPVIVNFLRHSATHCTTLKDLLAIGQIKNYLEGDLENWKKRFAKGWSPEVREACLKESLELIGKESWRSLVWENLNSGDSFKQHIGVQAARVLGIDVWNTLFAQLAFDPLNQNLYLNLMRTDDKVRIKQLVDFAQRNLSLEDVSDVSDSELAPESSSKVYDCLNSVLQYLYKFEGIGHQLIIAGLKSPISNNRNMALKVLSSWRKEFLTDEILSTLSEESNLEPDPSIKARMQNLLKSINV